MSYPWNRLKICSVQTIPAILAAPVIFRRYGLVQSNKCKNRYIIEEGRLFLMGSANHIYCHVIIAFVLNLAVLIDTAVSCACSRWGYRSHRHMQFRIRMTFKCVYFHMMYMNTEN